MQPTAGMLMTGAWATQLSVVTLVLSGVALVLFFGGAGFIFGPINDIFVAITLFLLMPGVYIVRWLAKGRVGPWFDILSWLALAGMLLAAIGQLLLVVGVIDLQTSFVTGGVGILALLVWIGALSAVAIARRPASVVSLSTGWSGAALTGLAAFTAATGSILPQPVLYALGLPLAVAAGVWIFLLGRDLKRKARVEAPSFAR